MLNLTADRRASAPGFLAAYPCAEGRPSTSNLNFVAGEVVANFVVVQPDADGDVCVYAHSIDARRRRPDGHVSEGFTGGAPQRLLDTRGVEPAAELALHTPPSGSFRRGTVRE